MPKIDQATSYLKTEKSVTQLTFQKCRIWNTNCKYNICPSLQLKLTCVITFFVILVYFSVDYFCYECKINSMCATISSTENKSLLQIKVANSIKGANQWLFVFLIFLYDNIPGSLQKLRYTISLPSYKLRSNYLLVVRGLASFSDGKIWKHKVTSGQRDFLINFLSYKLVKYLFILSEVTFTLSV